MRWSRATLTASNSRYSILGFSSPRRLISRLHLRTVRGTSRRGLSSAVRGSAAEFRQWPILLGEDRPGGHHDCRAVHDEAH